MSFTHARIRGLAVAAVAAIALAGCSGSSDNAPAATPSSGSKVETAALPSPSADATPVPTATPDPSLEATAEPSAGPTSSTGLSAAQQALVDRLRPDAVSDCKGNSRAEGDDVSAAVSCAGAGGTVLAFAYPTTEALAREVDRLASGLPVKQGKCSLGDDVRDTWMFNHVTQGDLVCRNADGQQVFYWSQYDQLVGFQITGDAPAGAYTTWKGFEPI